MKPKASFWQRIGIHDFFLKKGTVDDDKQPSGLTPNDVFKYIVEKFNDSIQELSFAKRIVFYHEYIIAFNPEDFQDFMDNKKGIFGLIVQESVRSFYEALKNYREQGKTVEPSSSKWVFRFVSNASYARGDKSFIGKLLPGSQQKEENLRVTFIPRQTGIAQTFDINPDILKGFTFYSEGYYEVPYQEDLVYNERQQAGSAQANAFARLETILPDKAFAGRKLEFLMRNEEIMVSGKEETADTPDIFRIPSDWVNTPHLRIRFNRGEGKFYLASFGEKTIMNEKEVPRCETAYPNWTELPINSRLVLNGIVGINIFKA